MTTAALRPRIVLADLVPGTWVRDAALVIGGAGLTGLAAQVSIHVPSITPVPFTLQTLAVLLTGAALGSVRGLASMGLYLLAGGFGVPWFANHEHGFAGASFGYVIGFVVAAGIVGELARRGNDRSVVSAIGLMAVGDAVLLTIGTIWLANDLHVSGAKAIELGVTPFLIGDAIKLTIAAFVLPAAWKLARR
jgi:biotin transport system substrate-specific component